MAKQEKLPAKAPDQIGPVEDAPAPKVMLLVSIANADNAYLPEVEVALDADSAEKLLAGLREEAASQVAAG